MYFDIISVVYYSVITPIRTVRSYRLEKQGFALSSRHNATRGNLCFSV